jgi:CheY-like chemotaxis protein/HPt (histidine-containing phosphotransfer) domain-containing protein
MGVDQSAKSIERRTMINLDDELAVEYLAESREHLVTIEADLLAIEKNGPTEVDEDLANRIFRGVHSIKGGAGFFDLAKIRELAHQTEDVLSLIRSREMVPTSDCVGVLLQATDRLSRLLQDPGTSNQADITAIMTSLTRLSTNQRASTERSGGGAAGQPRPNERQLRMLLAEDDFTSRLVLQTFLSRYGVCHVVVNGKEAVEAFRGAFEGAQRYDLICMDIMMPEMDGCEAVRYMRDMERASRVLSSDEVKIIMTTTLTEIKDVIRCFRELCDAYLMKPIDLEELRRQMKSYQLIQ